MRQILFLTLVCCCGQAMYASAAASVPPSALPDLAEDDFLVLSGPVSPRVALAVARDAAGLKVVVDVASFEADGGGTAVWLGLAASRHVTIDDAQAQVVRRQGSARHIFTVPAGRLVDADADWSKLRLAVAVAWRGGPLGQDRQRERFRHLDAAPTHAPLSPDPRDWAPFDLAEYAALVADRKRSIAIDFDQPLDGKVSIVVEAADGRRVRNLLAGQPLAKGRHRIAWDGLDDAGAVVPPGSYRWRSLSHGGVRPQYLMSFCNDGSPPWRTGSGTDMWGPDHSCLVAAAAGREWTFFAGPVAESGYAIVAIDRDGVKRMHYNPLHGTGIERVALAVAGDVLYAAHDGFAWGQHVDRTRPGWKATQKLTVTRFDVATGKVIDYPGGQRFAVVQALEVGPGAADPSLEADNLAGMAAHLGRLYISSRAAGAVLVVDAETGRLVGQLKLQSPGPLAARDQELLAVSGTNIVRLRPDTGAVSPIVTQGLRLPRGLAAAADGRIFVSDGGSGTVSVFDAAGKLIRRLGKPGGPYAGPYDPQVMVNPRGLAVAADGLLWVTEDRWNPKRLAAWDVATGRVVKQKFGPTSYGASGAGFDPADPTRWIGQGAVWRLDFASKSASCQSILSPRPGHVGGRFGGVLHYTFHRQDGRTFLIGTGGVTVVAELLRDGSLRDLVMLGSTHRFAFGCNWNPPPEFIEAFNRAYPDRKGKHADKGPGVLWVDRSGDGQCQADEFDFSTACDNFAGAYWGHAQRDLVLRVPATVKGRRVLVTLRPEGYHAGGAPRYPSLADALTSASPLDLDGNEVETAVDRFGRTVANSDPIMKAFAPDGRLVWTFPNRWTNVHGSHAAPLPETGVMQGVLFFLGMAPLDDLGDVFVVNGNHGRFFILTSDGMYVDEMFKDVRMGAAADAFLIGGECFGGCFGRAETDGTYYLQSGHTDYRIFRLEGLDRVRRQTGMVVVSAEQAVAAENNLRRKAASDAAIPKEATVHRFAGRPTIDGKDDDWPPGMPLRWDKSGRFRVAARAAYDADNLYLYWLVQDDSPWLNHGKDWTTLFKTGDSVNIELGCDPSADPKRRGPAPGDVRLLIAPYEETEIAVLYRYRTCGPKSPVSFTSPWRSETVDAVVRLAGVKVAVVRRQNEYAVEAAVRLADLGLKPVPGQTLRGDFGVLFGDPGGQMTMLRSWWSNQVTGIVTDVPSEIMLSPNLWGDLKLAGDK